jgi:hypothetical protein
MKGPIMGFFEFLAIVVVIEATARVISRWLKTKEGVTQKRVQELEQRIQVLAAQEVKDLQKRLSGLSQKFLAYKAAFGILSSIRRRGVCRKSLQQYV